MGILSAPIFTPPTLFWIDSSILRIPRRTLAAQTLSSNRTLWTTVSSPIPLSFLATLVFPLLPSQPISRHIIYSMGASKHWSEAGELRLAERILRLAPSFTPLELTHLS